MNATPQTIQVERELAHHIRWTIAKLVPDVFGERKDRGVNISGEHITISWLGSGPQAVAHGPWSSNRGPLSHGPGAVHAGDGTRALAFVSDNPFPSEIPLIKSSNMV